MSYSEGAAAQQSYGGSNNLGAVPQKESRLVALGQCFDLTGEAIEVLGKRTRILADRILGTQPEERNVPGDNRPLSASTPAHSVARMDRAQERIRHATIELERQISRLEDL